ncbi:sulfide dehydrogenase (flavoprotein) subunit SudA [Mahella australiensis 50-1 BON]|uniref:Sulfide dehydrogenase (Flavoprotein) subunit SudA n=2 Tax=Mahella TaxID=252965 RepID=F4A3G2_MAHA5|nr:sulfide dehydrogenase (flavoprotein) subunit SudA [Mahella australiensis 50-1 BON]
MPLKLERTPMREQDPVQRRRNFDEVALGYSPDEAIREAQRCIQCKHPFCVEGCPVHVQIPQFIKLITEGRFEDAAQKIKETNNLPAVCGRVCPQEEQCEARCVLNRKGQSVAIGRLERFAADYQMKKGIPDPERPIKIGKKVAVIGSGPAGLTAAADLAKLGYDVTVFESFHELGGVLVYGIPEFRLPKALVKQEIEFLKRLGVKFVTNVIVGNTLTIDDLFDDGYQAVFIGTGAGLPKFMDIPGESLNGVYSANEYLTRVNLMKAYLFPKADTPIKKAHKVAVVGGGNVAMDAARCALRLDADEVHIVYRRSEAEMPARAEEVHHAKEEGIIFDLLTNPIRIIGENGRVTGMECIKMELGEPDASGRRRPVPVKGSEFIMEVDAVIMALGTTPNPLIAATTHGLEIQPWGGIIADEATGATSRPGVYAGGDAVTGAATVILAMGAGKKAAAAIHEYLEGKK